MAPMAHVTAAHDLEHAVGSVDAIIMATGSKSPVMMPEWVRSGTHITAIGADALGKQELDVTLVARADVLVVDPVAQCVDHGEESHAACARLIKIEDLHELGAI